MSVPKRECGATLNVRQVTREEKVDMGENLQPKTVQIDSFPQVKYTCVDLGRAKSSTFKKLGKHWLGSLHLTLAFQVQESQTMLA